MAFYNDDDENQLDPNAPAAVQTSAGSSFISGQGGGGSTEQSDTKSTTPDNPGNFVGITQYLDQNKPQTAKLARGVGDFAEQQGAVAKQSLSDAQNQFGQAVAQNSVSLDQGLLEQAKADASKIASDEAKKAAFTKMRDANYAGPSAIEETDYWQPVMQAVSKAKQTADNTKSVEGRTALLTDLQNQNKQRATAGAVTLDNALLGASPDSKQIFGQVRENIGKLDQDVTSAQQSALEKATQAKQQSEQASKQTREALSAGYSNLGNELSSREAAKDLEQQQYVEALRSGILSGKLSADQLKALGMSSSDKTYGTDLSEFLSYVDGADRHSVATSEDVARQQALRELAGDYNLGDELLNSAAPIGQFGTGFQLRTNDFEQAKVAKQAAYEGEYNAKGSAASVPTIPEIKGVPPPNNKGNSEKSLAELVDHYTKLAATGIQKPGDTDRDKEANKQTARWYLDNYLLPATSQLQNKFNLNATLGSGVRK